ncbi:RNA polymerase sigma factor [Crossiella sp. CA198]|uniref:RNA polymerase sigma factor n=1 Tax=Crossiella sp. CA198 TaxID=3455607 RepID=UPI003F8D047B
MCNFCAGTNARDLITDIRAGLDAAKPPEHRGAALPRMLRSLATSSTAATDYADPRSTPELLAAVAEGDRAAESALYLRAAPELDKIASASVGSSALDREDLHQEGAERLLADARSGKIRNQFGGHLGPYLGLAIRGHMVNVAGTQVCGKPSDPGRLTQKLRQSLRATATVDGEYDMVAAAAHAREHHGWALDTFWAVRDVMFGQYEPLSAAEMVADDAVADRLARVGVITEVRALRAAARLSPREREVIDALYGEEQSTVSAATTLGVSRQAVSKSHLSALGKMRKHAIVKGDNEIADVAV